MRKDANDKKHAAAAATARSELDAERSAEKREHEAKNEELKIAATIRSAELAELAKQAMDAEALKAKVLQTEREKQQTALESQREAHQKALETQREE